MANHVVATMRWIGAGAGAHLIDTGEGHLHEEAGGMILTTASGWWTSIEPSSYSTDLMSCFAVIASLGIIWMLLKPRRVCVVH
jgi:hypothetical protein